MATGDLLGTLGALLVFASFWMKSSTRLRTVALASNVVFITYAFAADLMPILVLHLALLPLNAIRLLELRRGPNPDSVVRPTDWLIPHMRRRTFAAGEVLLREGDAADKLLLINRGVVAVGDQVQNCGPGNLLGAIGAFSPERRVVRSVVAVTAGDMYFLDSESARRLHQGNPGLAGYLIGLVTERLLEHARLRPALKHVKRRAKMRTSV